MTNQATPQGGEAQPVADVNPIDAIIDNAETIAPKETPEAEATEPQEPAVETKEDAFPKKAVNAISYRDKKIGRLQAERAHLAAELERFRQQTQSPQQPQKTAPNTGEPQEKDYANFADFIDAKNAYRIEQGFAKFEGKQKETQQTQAEQARLVASLDEIGSAADKFIAEVPDAQEIFDECEDTLMAMPDGIKRVFLEIGPGAELAVYNMAKEGKLEALASMSPARAAAEIGRAMTQAAKPKPVTKAPTPIPASRGSVPSGKSLENMSGNEVRAWLKAE